MTYRVSHLSDPRQIALSINEARRRTDALGLSSDQTIMTVDRPATISGDIGAVNANLSGVYQIAGVQVVGPRQTGWFADTGTAEKTAHTTYTAGTTLTFSASYVQSELTALATRLAAVEAALQNVTRGQKAVKDAALAHGLIGA